MRLPIQAPPVSTSTAKPVAAVVAQSCFGDCMLDAMGISGMKDHCSKDTLWDIAVCLVSMGMYADPETVVVIGSASSAYCGGKCVY